MSEPNDKTNLSDLNEDLMKQLEETILKNNKDLSNLMDKKDPKVNGIMEDVYKDFFGSDFIQKYNTDPSATGSEALKNAMRAAFDAEVDASMISDGKAPAENAGPEAAKDSSNSDGENKAKAEEEAKAEEGKVPEKSAQEELDELIGLADVKKDVKELTNLMKVQKLREEKGLSYVPTSLHLVFAGNPGTGKTTIARILARLYKEIGVLSKGQLVEVDRSGLVAGYVGQTAIKTQEKIKEAMGGILFIDEAYALAKEGNDFGQEAIDTILKAMEDNRKDFIVIVAGYTGPMEKFINSNPGLKSRFNKYLNFPDYSADELKQIFRQQCSRYNYKLTEEAEKAIDAIIEDKEKNKDDNFANAREMRNLFEAIITNQASRVAELEAPTDEDITTITPADLEDL